MFIFLQAWVVTDPFDGTHFQMEQFLPGKFQKWSNNAGAVDEEEEIELHAFSHWTYDVTGE